jgi:hypothetical protein
MKGMGGFLATAWTAYQEAVETDPQEKFADLWIEDLN